MRRVFAAAIILWLASCGTNSATPTVSPVPPVPATVDDLTPHYGSYSTAGGDTFVIARLGWFFDLETSDYRTIYEAKPPDRFSIGCHFREPLPKCADLVFAGDTLSVGGVVANRVAMTQTDVTIPTAGATLAATITEPAGTAPRGGIVVVHGAEPGQRHFY
ncbi:MAG TPA: hypothetical protein VHQ03_05450, partial [Candidatus Dormibacteraeota bacterium]|nr:hypothetical protein [Candidatus Dormibacteraeota bacterium]